MLLHYYSGIFRGFTIQQHTNLPDVQTSQKKILHLLSFFSLSAPTSVNPLMTVRWRAQWMKSSIRAVLLPRECPSPAAGPMMLMQVRPLYPAALWLFTSSAWPPIICWKNLSCTNQSLHRVVRIDATLVLTKRFWRIDVPSKPFFVFVKINMSSTLTNLLFESFMHWISGKQGLCEGPDFSFLLSINPLISLFCSLSLFLLLLAHHLLIPL